MATVAPAASHEPTRAATAPERAWTVLQADSLLALPDLPAGTLDAVVCDPPYGIDFNGHAWDGQAIRHAAAQRNGARLSSGEAFQAWAAVWAGECLRLLRPGAHLAAFGAPRTAHRLACALEDAGFELRDVLLWLYGTGMPKSRRLPHGQGTQLKPAYEPILLARKPLDASVTRNIGRHRTGALNVSACRVDGRWAANVLLAHHPACRPDACDPSCAVVLVNAAAQRTRQPGRTVGLASRLFYRPKASRSERDTGCEQLPRHALDLFPNAHGDGKTPAAAANAHPTVKPLALMRWLVRLVAPGGGLVLDPFCGSGSTGCAAVLEGRRFLGIEREAGYVAVAQARIAHWAEIAEHAPEDVPAWGSTPATSKRSPTASPSCSATQRIPARFAASTPPTSPGPSASTASGSTPTRTSSEPSASAAPADACASTSNTSSGPSPGPLQRRQGGPLLGHDAAPGTRALGEWSCCRRRARVAWTTPTRWPGGAPTPPAVPPGEVTP